MDKIKLDDILKLPVEDRINLVQEIWDSIAISADQIDPSADLVRELDRRLDAYQSNPEAVSDWKDVMKSLNRKKL